MRWFIVLAALLALVAGRATALEAVDSGPPRSMSSAERPAAPNSDASARNKRMLKAETLLKQGKAIQAQEAFEQVAATEHAADIELGILRSQMQAGQYQQALNFAAHTAGAHPDESAGTAFYAWLLHLGGQQVIALKTLEQAEQRSPGDLALARVHSLIHATSPSDFAVSESKEHVPAYQRLTPYAYGDAVPNNAHVVGTAILLPGARLAIAPTEQLGETDRLWLRNGLGRTVRASIRQKDSTTGLVLLGLEHPLDDPNTVLASEEAFPGSPAFAFGYLPGPAKEGAWPHSSVGFIGKARDASTDRPLGFDVPPGTQGGPVVNLKGRVVGIVLPPSQNRQSRFGGITAVRALAGKQISTADQNVDANRPVAELYEQAMRMTLQVIVRPSDHSSASPPEPRRKNQRH